MNITWPDFKYHSQLRLMLITALIDAQEQAGKLIRIIYALSVASGIVLNRHTELLQEIELLHGYNEEIENQIRMLWDRVNFNERIQTPIQSASKIIPFRGIRSVGRR